MFIQACTSCCGGQITGWSAILIAGAICAMSLAVLVFIAVVTWDVLHGS